MQEVILIVVSVFYCIAETIKLDLKRDLETLVNFKVVELEGTNETRQTIGVEILSPLGVFAVQLAFLQRVATVQELPHRSRLGSSRVCLQLKGLL